MASSAQGALEEAPEEAGGEHCGPASAPGAGRDAPGTEATGATRLESPPPPVRYLVCQRCNKKKNLERAEHSGQDPQRDLPQHITLSLHRVQGAGKQAEQGARRVVGGGGGGGVGSPDRGGARGHSGAGLQPGSVFAQPLGATSQTSSFVLLGNQENASSSSVTLQSHLNRLNNLQHNAAVSSQASNQHHGHGHVGHPSTTTVQSVLRGNLGKGVEDSFVDVGSVGSHHGLGSQHQNRPGAVTQVLQLCTDDHAERLRSVKGLLEAFDGNGAEGGGGGGIVGERGGGDKYLCGECAVLLQDEMERMISECEEDCQAYQQALQRLERAQGSSPSREQPLAVREFEREMERCRKEEEEEEAKVADLERQLEDLERERAQLKSQAGDLDRSEADYWRRHTRLSFELEAFAEERAGLVSKIGVACAQLDALKRTNIYNDVFHIWHDGPFGTINGFRMGKTGKVQVEWDEINAAWGQAVLLLHTMASSCEEFEFSQNRLMPMGSYPKVSDGKNTYELYGPVTQFLTANYDKAMCVFLQCLQEFSVYAKQYDIAHQTKPPFQLPYKIEGDKVCSHTVRLRFNINDKWTKALKYLLANLKVTLVWLTSSGPVGRRQRGERRQAD